MKKGIDVSSFQGNVDFVKVKNDGIDFVILNAGKGKYASQKSIYFDSNYAKAKAARLKIGAYWYSYALSVSEAKQEAQACCEALGKNEFDLPIYLDVEEASQYALGKNTLSAIVDTFCGYLEKKGIKSGLYISYSPFSTLINDTVKNKYSIWIAQYWNRCQYDKADIWQYTDQGKVNGISGLVDMNYLCNDTIIQILTPTPTPTPTPTKGKTVEQLAKEVIAGKWGNGENRKNRLTKAGYNFNAVQSKVNEIMANRKSNEEIAKEVIAGKWGNGYEREEKLKNAGYNYSAIQSIVNKIYSEKTNIKKYSIVKVKPGAKTYTGHTMDSFVYQTNLYVMEMSGDRVVIGIDGNVTAAVKITDLILVK